MCFKTLLMAATLTTCWAKSDKLAQDKVSTVLHTSRAASPATLAAVDDEVMGTSFGSHVMHSSSTPSNNRIPHCNSSGRFADPHDCGKYYDCVPSHNGGFVARDRSCLGRAFHPTLLTCVPLQMVKGCIPRSIRSLTDTNFQELCNNAQNEFICEDCRTLVMCVNGTSYTKPCRPGYVCSMKNDSFIGGVCYPGEPVECTCDEDYIFRPDLHNKYKFFSCDIAGSDPTIYKCPEGMVYKDECGGCSKEHESNCTAFNVPGPFVVNDDCSGYSTFKITGEGWTQIELSCSGETLFNAETDKCEDPCNWYSRFVCETEGRFANPGDCKKYFECIADPPNSDKLILVEQECPEGFEWSQVVNSDFEHCVPNKTEEEKCLNHQLKPDKCIIPNDWCTSGGCPVGFFMSPGTNQCFKIFKDMERTWYEAKSKCESDPQGLKMAEILDTIAILLRKYIIDNYGDGNVWLYARGTEEIMIWQSNNQEIHHDNPLWRPDQESAINHPHCLVLLADNSNWKNYPTRPYTVTTCTLELYTLCELVVE